MSIANVTMDKGGQGAGAADAYLGLFSNHTARAFSEAVQEKREEYRDKIEKGTTEPSFQIGAVSYTEKEWKKLLHAYDEVQDAIRKAAGLEVKEKSGGNVCEEEEEADATMLTSEYICCTCPSDDAGQDDGRYIIIYSKDGMRCIDAQTGKCEWAITFHNESQYEKIMEVLKGSDRDHFDMDEFRGTVEEMLSDK